MEIPLCLVGRLAGTVSIDRQTRIFLYNSTDFICLGLYHSTLHLPKEFLVLSVGNFLVAVIIFVLCFVEER
jgi:hypothetical protein